MTQAESGQFVRKNSFDAVRLLAAVTVLMAHQLNIAGYTLPGYGQPSLGLFGPKLADAGLYVFFALSGYLIFQSIDCDPRPTRFLFARALRIYPGAVANTMACIVLGAVTTQVAFSSYLFNSQIWLYLFHNALIIATPTQFQLPGVMQEARWPSINVPIWTLKYEILCYCSLLFLYKTTEWARVAMQPVLIITVGIMGASFVYMRVFPPQSGAGLDSLGSFEAVHAIRFFMIFFFGAAYAAREPWTIGARSGLLIALFSCLLLCPLIEVNRAISIVTLCFFMIEISKTSLLYNKYYKKIGDLSYGVYLYAFPIQMFTLSLWLTERNFVYLTLIDIVIVANCAFLSWRLIERPALKLKPKRQTSIEPAGECLDFATAP